ncbi:hypothetical protein TWF481_006381 [Arthrobotrys musiformis]|uniref:Histone chaperone domain-containing protein n=1 Tax=Arthrobotrys musiformis TaxID=47236 RepID=A0AAV9WHI0_9PEZI
MSDPEFNPPQRDISDVNPQEMKPDAEFNPKRDVSDASANEYRSADGYPVPVVEDKDISGVDPATAGGDRELARDEDEAINQNNIIKSRTRGAKPQGKYREPGDEEGLPGPDEGTSAVRGGR